MLFDSRQYEYADIAVVAGGVDLIGLRGISYNATMEKAPVYGKGRYAHSIQRGNYAVTGTLTVLQSQYENMVASSPTKSILDLNLDVSVVYGGNVEEVAGALTTDKIIGMQFTETPKELNQGDQFMEIALPFVALRVQNQS